MLEKRAQAFGAQHRTLGTVSGNPPSLQEDDAVDFRNDLLDVVRHEDDGDALLRDTPDHAQEPRARDDVQSRGRLVEDERTRLGDERPCDQHPPRFSGRHLIERFVGEVRRVETRERDGRLLPHVAGDVQADQEPSRREKPRKDRILAADAPRAVAVDEPLVQVRGHDAEASLKLRDVPAIAPEDPDRGVALARQGIVIADEQIDEGRLAGAVRAENRGVLPGANGQREAIEHAHAVLDHTGVGQLQDGVVGGRGRVHQGTRASARE